MSTVGRRARAGARWLLTPFLVVIDRRIGWRVRQLDERISRTEEELRAFEGYAQLMAGALAASRESHAPSNGHSTAPAVEDRTVPSPSPDPTATDRPIGFLDRLACPVCQAAVEVVPEIVTAEGRTKRGYVPCTTCQELVAVVRDFRVDFRTRGGPIPAQPPGPRVIPVLGELRIPFDDDRLRRVGEWVSWDERFAVSHGRISDSLEYRGRFTDALVHLVYHINGGVVDFFVDGGHAGTADLYSDNWLVLPFMIASDLPFDEHVLRIQPRGTRDARATAADVFVSELVLHGPRTEPGFDDPQPLNRGNPYTEVFERSVAEVPQGQLILEVGGGERRRQLPGYINLEFLTLESADVFGDIQHLPFQDDTFGLVLAQAVFEHVPNPFEAAAEMIRVTRPGGRIVLDAAFMQPLHAAPYHYFNMTPMGLAELFRSCTIVEIDHYGDFVFVVDWLLRSVGAHETVTETEFADTMDRIRAMAARLSHSDIRPGSSGFWVIAAKQPAAGPSAAESRSDDSQRTSLQRLSR
jgi:SAM-dependent methyltransferase